MSDPTGASSGCSGGIFEFEENVYMLQMLNAGLKFLNENSGAFTVVFSFVVTAATVVYVVLTRALVAETRRMRENQTEPDISIALVPSRSWLNWINMEIDNLGAGAAHNVRLQVEPDFENRSGQFLSQFGPFKNGIKRLPPGSKIISFVTEMVGKNSEKRRNAEFTICADYENSEGRSFHRDFPINLSYMEGLMAIDRDPLIGLHEHVKAIDQTLRGWAASAMSETEQRQWISESYFLKSQIGTFWIRPQAGMRHHYRLKFNNQRLDLYQGAWKAAEAVYQHNTGFKRWDDQKELESPPNLTGWEFGIPEILL